MPTKDAPKKLTKRVIDAAEPGAKDYCIWDSELKGFRLRVRSSGRKTFKLKYRAGRRPRIQQKPARFQHDPILRELDGPMLISKMSATLSIVRLKLCDQALDKDPR